MVQPGLFDVLLEEEAAPPRCPLEAEYGAALLLGPGRVAVNFVSTIDGVVSLGLARDDSRAVGGGVAADRVLMGMLRAVAGAIVVGAGTLRATLNHQWTASAVAPERAADLATLRAAAGLPAEPAPLLVVTTTGDIPAAAEAVARPAVPLHVLRLDAAAGQGAADAVTAARALAGGGPILCEGGPTLLGGLLEDGVPLDLFVTVAPQLAGRRPGSDGRRSLVEGVALPPFSRPGRLLSVRRAGNHLLLRYQIDSASGTAPAELH